MAGYKPSVVLGAGGNHPDVSVSAPEETARSPVLRQNEQAALRAELKRRLSLPLRNWEPVECIEALCAGAFARIVELERRDGARE